MKRFLLLFCAAVLSCALIVVPALAAESDLPVYEFSVDAEGKASLSYAAPSVDSADYRFQLFASDGSLVFDESFTMTFDEGSMWDFENMDPYAFSLSWGFDTPGTINFALWSCDDFDDGKCYDLNTLYPGHRIVVRPLNSSGAGAPVKGNQPSLTDSGSIMDVFAAVGSWIIGTLGTMTGIFWTGSELTMVGVLAVCGLGLAVIFLIIGLIQRFLHFRG